jgi:hypothetical protein
VFLRDAAHSAGGVAGEGFCRRRFVGSRPALSEQRLELGEDLLFAQDVILDPNTGKVLAVVRNGGVRSDGAKIAVLVGMQMYDLNGNLLGQLAAGAGSLPISFKNLLEADRPVPNGRWLHSYDTREDGATPGEVDEP